MNINLREKCVGISTLTYMKLCILYSMLHVYVLTRELTPSVGSSVLLMILSAALFYSSSFSLFLKAYWTSHVIQITDSLS